MAHTNTATWKSDLICMWQLFANFGSIDCFCFKFHSNLPIIPPFSDGVFCRQSGHSNRLRSIGTLGHCQLCFGTANDSKKYYTKGQWLWPSATKYPHSKSLLRATCGCATVPLMYGTFYCHLLCQNTVENTSRYRY